MGLERFCCDLSLTAKKAIFVTHCGYGVIGSRARLRIWCRETCRFESYHAHNIPYRNRQKPSKLSNFEGFCLYLKKRRLKNFSIDNTTNHPLLSTYWLSDDKQWVLIKQAFLFLSHAVVQSFNH